MKHIRLLMAGLAVFIGLGVAVPSLAAAATPKETVCDTLEAQKDCSGNPGGVNVNSIVRTIVEVLSWVVGVAAVIMIMIGGFRYITANGDSNAANAARNTILYAVIGLIIVSFAQFIVYFVLKKI